MLFSFLGHFLVIFRPFWIIFGPFWVWNPKSSDHHEILFASISLLSDQEYLTKICFFHFWGIFWSFLGHFGPFLTHFWGEIQSGHITMKFYLQVFHSYQTKNILLKYDFFHFWGIFRSFLGHFGPFLAHFGGEIQNGQITMKFYLQVFHSHQTQNILVQYISSFPTHFLSILVYFWLILVKKMILPLKRSLIMPFNHFWAHMFEYQTTNGPKLPKNDQKMPHKWNKAYFSKIFLVW